VAGMSDELNDDNSLRLSAHQDSVSDVGGMTVEKKYNWALILHSLPPSLNPREEIRLQPVDELNLCHKSLRGRSCRAIVLFMDFKIH
jgi:hypothetical protein